MRIPDIEKGVPIPKVWNPMDERLQSMVKDDCITLTTEEAPQWRNRISSHYPGQFTTRKIDNDTVRIWKK